MHTSRALLKADPSCQSHGQEIEIRPRDFPSYGWDNEYGHRSVQAVLLRLQRIDVQSLSQSNPGHSRAWSFRLESSGFEDLHEKVPDIGVCKSSRVFRFIYFQSLKPKRRRNSANIHTYWAVVCGPSNRAALLQHSRAPGVEIAVLVSVGVFMKHRQSMRKPRADVAKEVARGEKGWSCKRKAARGHNRRLSTRSQLEVARTWFLSASGLRDLWLAAPHQVNDFAASKHLITNGLLLNEGPCRRFRHPIVATTKVDAAS